MPNKYQPDYMYLRNVRTKRVHFFTFFQVLCLAALWVIKSFKVSFEVDFQVRLTLALAED